MAIRAILSRFAVVLACLMAVSPVQASASVKALLIAADYQNTGNSGLALANPTRDARMVAAALRRTSVEDIDVIEEPDAKAWNAAFESYVAGLSGDDIALVYVAGHGFQIDGKNYFLAADGQSLIGLDSMLQRLTEAAKGVVFVVDACRNNPVLENEQSVAVEIVEIEGGMRSLETVTLDDLVFSSTGLAQVGNLRGLSAVVFFSTEPGNVAEDGDGAGKGSPFAIEFAREIRRRQSLDETFRKVAVAVNDRTDGRQSPWRQGDLSFDVFVGGMRALPIP